LRFAWLSAAARGRRVSAHSCNGPWRGPRCQRAPRPSAHLRDADPHPRPSLSPSAERSPARKRRRQGRARCLRPPGCGGEREGRLRACDGPEVAREARGARRGDSPMVHSSARSARADIYTRITAEIVAAIEAGAGEWRMPWHHDGSSIARPRNVASDRAYRGINIRCGSPPVAAATRAACGAHTGSGRSAAARCAGERPPPPWCSGRYVAGHISSIMWRRSICGAGR
jgi:hypothetical protein